MFLARTAQFIAGLVTNKISAVLLGTVGVGIVNQLNFLTQQMSQFTTLSMIEAVVKQIAENKHKENAKEIICSVYKSYIVLVSFFLFISIIILLAFSNFLTMLVFGDVKFVSYFFIGLFTFPLSILSSIPISILRGFRDLKLISHIRLAIIFLNLFIAIPLIYFYNIKGAVIYIPISYIIELLFHYFAASNVYFKKLGINIKNIWNAPFRIDFIKELFYFTGFGFTVGTYGIFSEFTCRSIVVSKLGVDQIGLYSPIIMWASMLTGFLLPALSTYLYPRFCELKKTSEINGLLNDALRLGTIFVIPLVLLAIPFKEIIISIFFSKEFTSAAIYLPYHFFGLIFYVWWYVFTQAMTPTGRIKQHGIFQILYFSIDMLTTLYFVKKCGLYGWMLKSIVSPFIFFWVYSIYSYKRMNFRLSKDNVILMSFLIISTLSIILIINFTLFGKQIAYFIGPTLLFLSFFFLKQTEKSFLITKFHNIKNVFEKLKI